MDLASHDDVVTRLELRCNCIDDFSDVSGNAAKVAMLDAAIDIVDRLANRAMPMPNHRGVRRMARVAAAAAVEPRWAGSLLVCDMVGSPSIAGAALVESVCATTPADTKRLARGPSEAL